MYLLDQDIEEIQKLIGKEIQVIKKSNEIIEGKLFETIGAELKDGFGRGFHRVLRLKNKDGLTNISCFDIKSLKIK